MEGKAERLGSLGVFGIIGQAWKILHCRAILIGTITLALILPLSVANLLQFLSYQSFLTQILSNEIFHPTGEDDKGSAWRELSRQLTEFLVMESLYAVFTFAMWMLSTSAVVYSVSCLYTVKNVRSFATVMKMASMAWKRVAITSIWFFVFLVGIFAVSGFGWILQIWGLRVFDKAFAVIFLLIGLVICVGMACVGVYVRMTWQLATVMSVLESKHYGLEAMKRSHHLLQGKRRTALRLTALYAVIQGVYYYGVRIAVVKGHWESYVYAMLFVAIESVISVMWELWQSVLYFVCKDYHEESVDESREYLPLTTTDVVGESMI